jgi:hypothetical protein
LLVAEEDAESQRLPELPNPAERMDVRLIDAPHPATRTPADLLSQCSWRAQRRSGPGGQHRNKTSSGVFLHHEPTGIIGEATERRSQADNRAVALQRLRFRLAVEVRTMSIIDGPVPSEEQGVRDRFRGRSLRLNDRNADKPAILALILNDLHASGGQPSAVAPLWETSTSAIVALLRSHGPAFTFVNAIRASHGRPPLK